MKFLLKVCTNPPLNWYKLLIKTSSRLQRFLGTLITKTIGHRQVFLVSHLTYSMHILYLGKLTRPKYHEFSLKLLIFPMLQY